MKKLAAICLALTIGGCDVPKVTQQPSDNHNRVATEGSSKQVAARSGPFGFNMGQSIEGLSLEKLEKASFYIASSPPKSHPDIETVVIEAYPETGICQIRGVGRDISNDGDGLQVRQQVKDLAGALETKYGSRRLVNRCSGGDIQCRNDFWMMTLNDGERFYGYHWDKAKLADKPGTMGEITVAAAASNINDSYPIVEYHSAKVRECEKARKSVSATSL